MNIRERYPGNSFLAIPGVTIPVREKRDEIIAINEISSLHTRKSPINTIIVMYKNSSNWAKTQGFSQYFRQNLLDNQPVTRGCLYEPSI